MTLKLEGRVSTHGPIDEQRRQSILSVLRKLKGVHGCRVRCEVFGNMQRVTVEVSFATLPGLNRLDVALRGIGGLPTFFATPASPIVVGLLT